MALQLSNIKIDKYYSSEIDKHANKMGRIVYPQAIELGDVSKWREWSIDWANINIVAGGSPCQGFSFAGKQLSFDDPRSKLFFVFVDILNHIRRINPQVKFLLENVRMKREYQDIISKHLGVEPIPINSNLVSAQNRYRLYWTNIEGVEQPEDKGIFLKDIVHERRDLKEKSVMSERWCNWWKNNAQYQLGKKYSALDPDKAVTMTARQYSSWTGTFVLEALQEYIVPFDKTLKILDKEVERGKVDYFRKDSAGNRVYHIHGKACTLMGNAGGGAAKMGQYLFGKTLRNMPGDRVHHEYKKAPCLTFSGYGRTAGKSVLVGITNKPRGHNKGGIRNDGTKSPILSSNSWEQNNRLLFGCISPDRVNKKQNGQRFNTGQKFYTLTAQDRHGVLIEGYIRKLTPIECGRLQTIDDQVIIDVLKSGVSQTQVYKALGNGWTIDIISHILNNLKQEHRMPVNEENKIKDLTIDTSGYAHKEPNCELAIKGRMKERNPNPKTHKSVINGVVMPTRKSAAKRVWEISNHLSSLAQAPAKKEDVWDACAQEDITLTTAKRNHSQWRKFYGADDVVVTTQTDAVEVSETLVDGTKTASFAPSQGESFLVSKDPGTGAIETRPLPELDTSFNTIELEKGMPTAPPSMVADKETPEWMKAPSQESVPDIESPPNGWGIKPGVSDHSGAVPNTAPAASMLGQMVESRPQALASADTVTDGMDGVDLSGFYKTIKVVTPKDLGPSITGLKGTNVGAIILDEHKTVSVEEISGLKTQVNHILAMGKIQVYTTQPLSDVATIIMELIKDNPVEVREFLDANS